MFNPQPTPETDLNWLAFRYFSREMSTAESMQFEELLATDQAAREALAAVVEIVGAVRLAEETAETGASCSTRPEPSVWQANDKQAVAVAIQRMETASTRRFRATGGVWARVGLAACILALFGGGLYRIWISNLDRVASSSVTKVQPGDAARDGLSDAWASLEMGTEPAESWENSHLASRQSELSPRGEADADEDELVPDWLLAAVAMAPSSELSEMEEGPLEN